MKYWKEVWNRKKIDRELERRVERLETLVMEFVNELGYTVSIDSLNPDWQYPEIVKKDAKRKKED